MKTLLLVLTSYIVWINIAYPGTYIKPLPTITPKPVKKVQLVQPEFYDGTHGVYYAQYLPITDNQYLPMFAQNDYSLLINQKQLTGLNLPSREGVPIMAVKPFDVLSYYSVDTNLYVSPDQYEAVIYHIPNLAPYKPHAAGAVVQL